MFGDLELLNVADKRNHTNWDGNRDVSKKLCSNFKWQISKFNLIVWSDALPDKTWKGTIKRPPEGPLTEDSSTKNHYENGRFLTTEATIKIKHFRKGSFQRKHMFIATTTDGKTTASDNCKATLESEEQASENST